MKKGVYFVSGIDTDAGKSIVTGILAKRLNEQGLKTITQKFIQTDGENCSDILLHRKIMGIPPTAFDKDHTTCPLVFSYPASPHLAAKLDNREIDLSLVEKSYRKLSEHYDIVLVEGAGGLHVPLKGFYTTLDYIQESGLPLIFVTSGKLGSINHTLLSLEVCRYRNIPVALVVYNRFFGTDKVIDEDTFAYIREYLNKFHPDTELSETAAIEF